VAVPGGLPEWLTPITSIVPAQLIALEATRLRGRDPERPPNIYKVTRTT
jgi:glucosamine--fructose-6-phosphate aminotransferase (isomerizing)